MRFILLTIIALIFVTCKRTSQGVNFGVRAANGDTLSYFYYHSHEKYDFYDRSSADTALSKDGLSKIPGKLVLGIKEKVGNQNRFLVFRGISESGLEVTKEPQVPFLDKELSIDFDYDVEFTENYIDSSNYPVRKYETHVAVRKQTRDTIVFQEVSYFIKGNHLMTHLIIYNNLETREEMRLVLGDALRTIKESVKDVKK